MSPADLTPTSYWLNHVEARESSFSSPNFGDKFNDFSWRRRWLMESFGDGPET